MSEILLDGADFYAILRKKVLTAGSKSEAARDLGINVQTFSSMFHADRSPSRKLLDALGLERVERYRVKAKA
ncbi:MAG: hypothetical protein ABF968_08985 [Acetobacter sp.]|uniref:hypothetical protein n=1 Tax=Acetobacter sp. TaxID=440 RepID=UPI0039ED10D0